MVVVWGGGWAGRGGGGRGWGGGGWGGGGGGEGGGGREREMDGVWGEMRVPHEVNIQKAAVSWRRDRGPLKGERGDRGRETGMMGERETVMVKREGRWAWRERAGTAAQESRGAETEKQISRRDKEGQTEG